VESERVVKLTILVLRLRRSGVEHPLFTGRQSRRREEKKRRT